MKIYKETSPKLKKDRTKRTLYSLTFTSKVGKTLCLIE